MGWAGAPARLWTCLPRLRRNTHAKRCDAPTAGRGRHADIRSEGGRAFQLKWIHDRQSKPLRSWKPSAATPAARWSTERSLASRMRRYQVRHPAGQGVFPDPPSPEETRRPVGREWLPSRLQKSAPNPRSYVGCRGNCSVPPTRGFRAT